MKRIFIALLRTFILSVAATAVIFFIIDSIDSLTLSKPVSIAVYCITTMVILNIMLFLPSTPRYPAKKLGRLRRQGKKEEYVKALEDWRLRCERKGCGDSAAFTIAQLELTNDSGSCEAFFEKLAHVDAGNLSPGDRMRYYNSALYAAVMLEDTAAADGIYESGKMYLISADDTDFSADIDHTLGCYRYLKRELKAAERLFTRSLAHASAASTKCCDHLALCACYLDTGRVMQAKRAVRRAAALADSGENQAKVSRAKKLVEAAFEAQA